MANHTPGPWRVSQKRAEMIDINHSSGGVAGAISLTLAKVVSRQSWQAEAEANARLIAAAPELLVALEVVLRVADRATDEFEAARAAIAKATGEKE